MMILGWEGRYPRSVFEVDLTILGLCLFGVKWRWRESLNIQFMGFRVIFLFIRGTED